MDKSFPDIELVKRLQNGDLEAFDLIYERYSGNLYSFGFKYLRSAAEAEELVQSVFLKLWENHKHLNPDLSFKSYIFTIAYNEICKFFRRKNYLQKFINEEFLLNNDSSLETEQNIDYQSLLNRVQQIVEKLPERQRIIFKKSREEGKTTKEISKDLGLSSGTVDNYISAALSFVRKQLKSEDLALVLFISMFLIQSEHFPGIRQNLDKLLKILPKWNFFADQKFILMLGEMIKVSTLYENLYSYGY